MLQLYINILFYKMFVYYFAKI